jgi:tetratricopeptide (TPR) repeat protein
MSNINWSLVIGVGVLIFIMLFIIPPLLRFLSFAKDMQEAETLMRRGKSDQNAIGKAIEVQTRLVKRLDKKGPRSLLAQVQYNLGTAYMNYRRGDHQNNLRLAISNFEEALEFRTLDNGVLEHLRTVENLGTCYHMLDFGNKKSNIQKAIKYYDQAMEIYPMGYQTPTSPRIENLKMTAEMQLDSDNFNVNIQF